MSAEDFLAETTQAFALSVLKTLPKKQQTYANLNKRLRDLDHKPVKRATFFRWKAEPVPLIDAVEEIVRALPAPEPSLEKRVNPPPRAVPVLDKRAVQAIPQELLDAVGHRMLIIAKGEGLDAVERNIVKMANAIGERADKIAEALLQSRSEKKETKAGDGGVTESTVAEAAADAAQRAVLSLQTMAAAMGMITDSRVKWSEGFRNYAEGDRLSGEGAKFHAEAETVRQTNAADGARDVSPGTQQRRGADQDASFIDDAVQQMRDYEKGK